MGAVSAISEQHVDIWPSRIKRDDADVKKLIHWFSSHHLFPQITELLSKSRAVELSAVGKCIAMFRRKLVIKECKASYDKILKAYILSERM